MGALSLGALSLGALSLGALSLGVLSCPFVRTCEREEPSARRCAWQEGGGWSFSSRSSASARLVKAEEDVARTCHYGSSAVISGVISGFIRISGSSAGHKRVIG